MERLDLTEIEKKIEYYQQRVNALGIVINDLKETISEKTLEKQMKSYRKTILELNEELVRRKKESVK
jgi:prefoldin subunit 5